MIIVSVLQSVSNLGRHLKSLSKVNTEQSICRQHRRACYHEVPVYTQQLYTHAKCENCNILLKCYESEEMLSLTPSV